MALSEAPVDAAGAAVSLAVEQPPRLSIELQAAAMATSDFLMFLLVGVMELCGRGTVRDARSVSRSGLLG
ncbi:MAG: hypothetical protein MUP13_08695 [Thermoanaerobaculales bacterium]|nr:hypothetical protein [Thermoanaerobaculales bacterium]